jgi:hypothetical protein
VLTAADHMTRTPEPLESSVPETPREDAHATVPAIAEMKDDQLSLFR